MKSADPTSFDSRTSGLHSSYWLDTAPRKNYGPLRENIHGDVVIVGGGLGGVTAAYCLSQAGKKVVLIEDGDIASGETGRTTAHLVSALDDRFASLESIFGEEDTKLIADSHKAAIRFIEETVRKENINCQFEWLDGYLLMHPSDKPERMKEEYEAARRAGMNVSEVNMVPGITNYEGPALKFAHQAQFHPLTYVHGLCDAIVKLGGKIFTGTHAQKIDHTGIETKDGFTVKANHVVVATNTPVLNTVAMHLKQTAHRTYVIAGLVKKGSLPKALWWDTGDHKDDASHPPYHYVRVHPYNNEYDLLISGGEDHPTGDIYPGDIPEEKRYQRLETWTRQHFPIENILYRWSGQVLEPVDSMGFIGRNPWDRDNVYIITGDSGTGMTHCTIGGMLITDLIMGKENPWEEIYNPSRITFKTGNVFFKELMRGVMGLLKGAPEDEKVKELSQIRNGEAKVINLNGHKCGAYRDEHGEFHIVSARCTHLKAVLNWNADEKSWDCPWHGSRFTCEGHVINGPANSDLPVYSESEELSHSTEDFKDIR
jgi:glycine/D-amino acid oxidase-like deaminating enzyme/nitrite reductase/ring-hydroxylating ferredoxin subunit